MQTDSESEQHVLSATSGCLYATVVVFASAGLLFLNALMCLGIYSALPKFSNEMLSRSVGQMFYFVVPVLMLVVEWNVWDRLYRLFRSGGN